MDLRELLKKRVLANKLILLDRKTKFAEYFMPAFWQAIRRRINQLFVVKIPNLLGMSEFARVKTFFGSKMKVLRRDKFCMDNWGVIGGGTDILTIRFFVDKVWKGATFIDGGAYIGWYALLASELVGEAGSVHAFEPTPGTLPVLMENIAGRKNIFLNNVALYKRSGPVPFSDFGERFGYSNAISAEEKFSDSAVAQDFSRRIMVSGVSIDDYCAKTGIAPDFIKLDLEGGEYDALIGSKAALQAKKPIIVIEMSQSAIQSGEYARIADFLGDYGYQAYRMFADKDFNMRFEPFMPKKADDFVMENIIFSGVVPDARKDELKPLVSVIIPTYNDSCYLPGAIKSVLGQTYSNWELIIADDGSTDNTKAVVYSFSDKRIYYFYQENKGLASARNLGLKHCRGKYVALLDADDLFLPEKLEKHVSYLENYPECDFTYDEILFFREEQPGKFWKVLIKHLSGFLKEDFIRMGGHCIGPSAAFFRRELFEKYGGFPDGWRRNEDYFFWLKLAVGGVYFQHLEGPATLSRLRSQSLSHEACHMKEAAELNLKILDWLDKTLVKKDPARRHFPTFLLHAQRRLVFGYLILKDKQNGLHELKRRRYGWFFIPIVYILPANLISFLLICLRRIRERFLFQEAIYDSKTEIALKTLDNSAV